MLEAAHAERVRAPAALSSRRPPVVAGRHMASSKVKITRAQFFGFVRWLRKTRMTLATRGDTQAAPPRGLDHQQILKSNSTEKIV
ncbi:hypothetical protein [Paraburkholderia lycopersici]|uniref:hypothetical protein n=1 Tax=Paraburkholderia lycopersici TaxID=416944 RepID=UPI001160FC81|nr:hypothetical protein [Paraburkholderia lycopersici]